MENETADEGGPAETCGAEFTTVLRSGFVAPIGVGRSTPFQCSCLTKVASYLEFDVSRPITVHASN